MIDRIIELSIRHRWAVMAAAVALGLAGVFAVYHTPMDAIPDVSEDQIIVFADWPGHSPREIEDQIAYPLSTSLQGLPGVRVVRSSSEFNFASISVILQDGVDFYFARQQIAERLARAGDALPGGVKAYLAPDGAATGQIFWYTIEGKDYDLARLRSIQDWYVRGQLASVPGVAEVASVGGRVLEYQIELDPRRLADAGLTPGMVTQAVADSNASVGGQVIEKANAEYLVRGIGWLGARPNRSGDDEGSEADSPSTNEHERIPRDLEEVVIAAADGRAVRLTDVATVSVGSKFRRGVLEMHGNESVGGVVLMRYGENPLEVTSRLRAKISELAVGLPPGVRVVAAYDRTPLITGAVSTVTGALLEAMATASICVLAVLLHFRTSLVITLTLPLAALSSFVAMWLMRRLGIADIQTNIMSLAGIVVSIGVLVDSSIVMAENVMHVLKRHFGHRPVEGDVRWLVLPACRTVGRPIFFSVAIMLISFLPVFCLGGIEGKLFRPLAATKSLAMLAVGCLSITLVPALATIFIRGRLRDERQSWLVRSFAEVYRPVLDYCLSHPAPLIWLLAVTFLASSAPLGHQGLLLATLLFFIVLLGAITRNWRAAIACTLSLALVALAAERNMRPLLWQKTPPLNEGMVMDMPITVPRASITEAADDLKARDMVLCRFPEVAMVMGKAGRAETPTDPAPVDMIETMVEFRPRELWPKRKLTERDARRQTKAVLAALAADGAIERPADGAAEQKLVDEATAEALPRFDGVMREYAYLRNAEFEDSLRQKLVTWLVEALIARLDRQHGFVRPPASGEIAQVAQGLVSHADHHLAASPAIDDVTSLARHAGHTLASLGLVKEGVQLFENKPPIWQRATDLAASALGKTPATFFTRLTDDVLARHRAAWREHVRKLNGDLFTRGTESYTRLAIEEVLTRATISDAKLADYLQQVRRFRARPLPQHQAHQRGGRLMNMTPPPDVAPQPKLKALQERLASTMPALLWASEPADLSDPGGELDRALQMPGWANVWTRPIQNRVDMLFTGVNTDIGVRVLGRQLDDVVGASQEIAAVLKQVPGSEYVMAEEIRGKGYVEICVDRKQASRLGVSVGDVNDVIETALGGKLATTTVEGRQRHGVRVLYARNWREDEETIRGLPVPRRMLGGDVSLTHRETDRVGAAGTGGGPSMPTVPLADVADVRIVEGPASIKSENGLLRNYVRLNVRGRSATDFIDEARRALADQVVLPPGVYLEWTGQFEHEVQAAATLTFVLPLVIGLILAILYWTYHDLADALLMLLAVPGAMAGGVLFQWLMGYDFSVTVLVGYIACFGMATSTGIIMLVYLREAVARRGGLERMSLADLREAVMEGAVHRLRPKLLTEGTTILGLAPMLWATGTGAEVIKPMAAPVLGGILVADEVIDLLLPVLFYWVRRRRILLRSGLGEANPAHTDSQTPDAAIAAPVPSLPLAALSEVRERIRVG